VKIFKPEGEIEVTGGEVTGGDEVEDGVLEFGKEFDEGVTGAGAGEGVEFVEAELVVEDERGRGSEREGLTGIGGKGGVDVGGEALRTGSKDMRRDGLKGGELRGAQILRDVDGAVVDELLEAKAGRRFGDRRRLDEVLILSTVGHDTTLPDDSAAYVRVLIGRRNEEEKSRLRVRGSPPKVVCRCGRSCAVCG